MLADRKLPSVERRRLQPQDRELGNQMHGKVQSGSSGGQLTTGDEDRAGVALRGQWHISDSLLHREQKEALSSQGGFMNMVFTTENRNHVYNTHGEQSASHAAHRPADREHMGKALCGSRSSALSLQSSRGGDWHSRDRKPQQLTAKFFLPSRNMIQKY